MKKLIALLLSIFTILLVSTCAFAFSGGGISGGVNGDGNFTGGGFSGGSRLSSVFGSSPPSSSSLSTMLSYEALNNLTANINLGISLGEIEILDGNIQAVTVTKRTDWNAYVITGVYNGNTYVIVNASGGRYYSPINDGYTVVAIAGAGSYYLTNRPIGAVTTGYLGDLYLTYDNWSNVKSRLNELSSNTSYYTFLYSVNGEMRYYIASLIGGTKYYVCNSSGQLFYTLKENPSADDDTGGGSTFDPTEVITAINSVYDAVNSMSTNIATRITNLRTSVDNFRDQFGLHMNNTVLGFESIGNQLSTLNSYFTDLSGLFPVQETITLLGSDTRVAWDSADRITNVTAAGFNNGDLTIKTNRGPLVDESGYENVALSSDTTEYRLYNDANGYRRIVADNEYPVLGNPIPDTTLYYYTFDNTLAPTIGDLTFNLNTGGQALYGAGVNGQAFKFNGATTISTYQGSALSADNGNFTLSFWFNLSAYPNNYDSSLIKIDFGDDSATSPNYITLSVQKTGRLTVQLRSPTFIYSPTTDDAIPLNTWTNIAITCDGTNFYVFLNGSLQITYGVTSFIRLDSTIIFSEGIFVKNNSMLDELILVDGDCLWSASFNASNDAVFSEIASDYFLPCTDQTIGLVFDDTINQTLSPTDVNGNAITMGRLEDDFSEIYMDTTTMQWYCHDPQTQTEILLSSANQQIMNDTIYVRQNYTMLPADQITADALQNLLPVDSPVYLDMPEGAKLTITYDHYSGWFRMMYILMDKQTKLLSDLDIVNETIINVENTVIDITNSNPAYNVFYITKTDGTTESVGDAAKDAAVFVGDVLSMFYRLVFDDALDNAGVIQDFEDVLTTTNTGVNVW